jgi:hypothetical protein
MGGAPALEDDGLARGNPLCNFARRNEFKNLDQVAFELFQSTHSFLGLFVAVSFVITQ